MGALMAEASPCCPSPLAGSVFVVVYVVAGLCAYVWLAFRLTQWARSRRR